MRRHYRVAVLLLPCLFLLFGCLDLIGRDSGQPPKKSAAGTVKCAISGWKFTRERKTVTGSNRVTTTFELKNSSDRNLNKIAIALIFTTNTGEPVAAPLSMEVGTLARDASKPVGIVGEFIPIFDGYELKITYEGGQEEWVSYSASANPEPKASDKEHQKIARPIIVDYKTLPNKNLQLSGMVRIKNFGGAVAQHLQLTVLYYGFRAPPKPLGKDPGDPKQTAAAGDKKDDKTPADPKAKTALPAEALVETVPTLLDEWTGPLPEGELKPGEEKQFFFFVPKAAPKDYFNYALKVSCEVPSIERQLSQNTVPLDPMKKDLQAGEFQFERKGERKQDLEVRCRLFNGLAHAVNKIKLELSFFNTMDGTRERVKQVAHEVSGPLEPGKFAETSLQISEMPVFTAYEQAMDFQTLKIESKPAPALEKLTFKNLNTVEVLLKEFKLEEDGTLKVACSARNGRNKTVQEVKVNLRVNDADGKEIARTTRNLSGRMMPGEVRNFVIEIENCKASANCESEVHFNENVPATAASSVEVQERQTSPESAER